jgi:hypothetical protein
MSKDLTTEPRCKFWTDGTRIIMGIQKAKQEDEGGYRAVLTNEHGTVEHEFNIYITGHSNFRVLMLLRRREISV